MTQTAKSSQQLRIIAGKWRHRKINFYAGAGARPTLDRIRETLFNWLQPYIANSNCLDLFAGSGILGIEALSRGANSACFMENQAEAIKTIKSAINTLDAEPETSSTQSSSDLTRGSRKNYYTNNLPQGLSQLSSKFNIIFLDPPYHTNLLQQTLDTILKLRLLDNNGVVYFEAGKKDDINFSDWKVLKHKATKSLQYGLLTISGNQNS